jgi:hypothetical protein
VPRIGTPPFHLARACFTDRDHRVTIVGASWHRVSGVQELGAEWLALIARHLLDRLMDVERAELQRMQNSAVIDNNLVVRRLQRGLDLLRLRDRI